MRETLFFRVNGGTVAEKSWLACATVPGVVALPSIPDRFVCPVELTVPGDFFFSLLTLCYCVLHVLRYFVHWNWCIKAMCSTVVCCNVYCVVQFSLCRSQWNGCVKVPHYCGCVILLCFAVESHQLYCRGWMKLTNGALAADYSSFRC